MRLILIIAAGVLLAFILLPLLGPIVMAVVGIAVFAWMIYGLIISGPILFRSILTLIAVGKVGVDTTKEVKKNADEKAKQKRAFKAAVKTSPEFCRGLAASKELLTLQNFRYKPIGLWYSHIFKERFHNCYMTGAFRIEDDLNRAHLEKCLKKIVSRGKDQAATPQADALYQEILSCHDSLCKMYSPPESPKLKPKEHLEKSYLSQYAFNQQNRKLHASTCKRVNDTFRSVMESDLDALLGEIDGEVTCCKLCLKDDEKTQALVEAHNRKIRGDDKS